MTRLYQSDNSSGTTSSSHTSDIVTVSIRDNLGFARTIKVTKSEAFGLPSGLVDKMMELSDAHRVYGDCKCKWTRSEMTRIERI